jgi:hypothetical protein
MIFCRYSLTLLRTAALCSLIVIVLVPTRALAMELKIVGNQLILSGPVVGDEPEKVREALTNSPGIDTVILRNSGGGDAPAGYQVGSAASRARYAHGSFGLLLLLVLPNVSRRQRSLSGGR